MSPLRRGRFEIHPAVPDLDPVREGVVEEALDIVLRAFADRIGADAATLVGIPDPAGGPLPVIAAWTPDRGERKSAPPPADLLWAALEAKSAVLGWAPAELGGPTAGVVEIAAPIRDGDRALGAIHAHLPAPVVGGAEELRWVPESYARLAGLCIGGDQLLSAALSASAFDPLTGCLTYSQVIEVLRSEIDRARRHGRTVSCCFLDLDGFKAVNDSEGHLEGNRILALTGRTLTYAARAYDAVGRFGGDEFLIVLPECDRRCAELVAERLRAVVRKALAGVTPVSIEVSIGIAEWDRRSGVKALIEAADSALYREKRAGAADRRARTHALEGLLTATRELMYERPQRRFARRRSTRRL